MNRFNKFFWWEFIAEKEINILLRKNKDNNEVRLLRRFEGTHKMPPLYDISQDSLYEELTAVFGDCQRREVTMIGRKVNKIITSNLLDLYNDITKHIGNQIDRGTSTIKSLSNDRETPCYKYINLFPELNTKQTPWINLFLSSFSKADQVRFKLYLASILDEDNTSKQALLLLDRQGNSGKSAFINALIYYLGDATTLIGTPNMFTPDNRFAIANLKNKKLLYVPENKNANIMMSQTMLCITGGDRLDGERKGVQQGERFIPNCKVLIVSNDGLAHTGSEYQQARLVVCELSSSNRGEYPIDFLDSEGNFKYGNEAMTNFYREEMSDFLDQCLNLYHEYGRPAQTPTILGYTKLEGFLTDQNRIYKECFNKYFEYVEGENLKKLDGVNVKAITFLKKEILAELRAENIRYNPSNQNLKTDLNLLSKHIKGIEYIYNIKLKDHFIFENNEIVLKKLKNTKKGDTI